MADTTDDTKNPQAENPDAAHTLPITIHRQYIRDLSFESPSAPESLKLMEAPEMEVSIDVQARKIEDKDIPSLYEVVLLTRVTTVLNGMPVFMAELEYATLASIGEEVPEDQHHPILFIEIPRVAFPYASQIITNSCMNGGFPPIYLKPVDFYSLYMTRNKDMLQESSQSSETKSS